MSLLVNIENAQRLLLRNKFMSFLSMLGIIIGVMSLIIILSIGAGAQSLILNQVKSMGSNLIGVLPGKSDDKGPPVQVFGIVITTLTDADVQALRQANIPGVVAATAYVRGLDTIVYNDQKIDSNFVGVNASYLNVEDTVVERGRFFTSDEEQSLSPVAVLGSEVAAQLFADEDPLGVQIKIKKTNFRVVGVMKKRGVAGFQNQDSQIFVPLPVAQKLLLGIEYINFARLKIDNAPDVLPAIDDIKSVLRERHRIETEENDDFSVRSTNQGLAALTTITNALKFFLAAIAAIALVVGGLGIMNIMLAAVEERTVEIGLRKALGATVANITQQFLVETAFITFVGGVIGILLGSGISWLVAFVAIRLGYQWDLVISPVSIVVAGAVSIGIGLIFGITPARRASRLNPIEALRYE